LNQERFDELARGLATNRLSRRQVIKSFVVGVLLAGPLGAISEKPASASPKCVKASCVSNAKQPYASCKKRCGNLSDPGRRRSCLTKCNDAFAGQLLTCGCVAYDINSSTPGVCGSPCTAKTLFARARKNTNYLKIARYLTSNPGGFKAKGAPKATVLRQAGKQIGEVLQASYTHPGNSRRTAELFYVEDTVNRTKVQVLAYLYEKGTLKYLLGVNVNSGEVQKEPVHAQQGPAKASSAGPNDKFSSAPTPTSASYANVAVRSAGSSTCSSICNKGCAYAAGAVCGPVGAFLCNAGAVALGAATTGAGAVAGLAACGSVAAWSCKEGAKAGPCSDFCKSACDCAPLENCAGGYGYYSCCGGCQTCNQGKCASTCRATTQTCCAPSGGTRPICVGLCPLGQHLHENTCHCVCDDGSRPCGPNLDKQKCCANGLTCCKGQCVDANSDPSNCGACGNACPAGESCNQGTCENKCGGSSGVSCPPDKPDCCKGQCVDTNSDPSNCGKCVNACPSDKPLCCKGVCLDPYADTYDCRDCDCLPNSMCCGRIDTNAHVLVPGYACSPVGYGCCFDSTHSRNWADYCRIPANVDWNNFGDVCCASLGTDQPPSCAPCESYTGP
jgi:hypothetical protein